MSPDLGATRETDAAGRGGAVQRGEIRRRILPETLPVGGAGAAIYRDGGGGRR